MLTPEQEGWIFHLSDETKIKILPFDPTASEKFEVVKKKIESVLGEGLRVVHRGATSLGISGQDEIDMYLPVSVEDYISLQTPLEKIFGKPGSIHQDRIRYVTSVEGKHIDVFLIKESSSSWKDGVKIEKYLLTHPEALESYRILKEQGDGLSTREYYRRKVVFYNDILSKMSQITFRRAKPDELDLVLLLLKSAALWLRERKINYWQEWIAPPQNFVNWIKRGFAQDQFFMVEREGEIVGCFRLIWEDEQFWGKREDQAGYIHSFTVARELAGQGIGYQILDMIQDYCLENGNAWLRLDCAANNRALRNYYEEYGFKLVGEVFVYSPATLYEKPIK
jgi:ribosomal protein S18 acetylase RimI-like enzyme/GrpB-like predicted nucleotidyltransferase (UPF0157 family)